VDEKPEKKFSEKEGWHRRLVNLPRIQEKAAYSPGHQK